MARVAKAAQQLLDQVGGIAVGDPDGFGVVRSVEIFRDSCDVDLDLLRADRRVRGVAVMDGEVSESALVTFVAGTAADSTEPFDL